MTTARRRLVIGVVLIALILGAPRLVMRRHCLSFLPPDLNVISVAYAKTQSAGFGPGGNETGIIVYGMPPETRTRLEARGERWLETLPGQGRDLKGVFSDWHQTPFSGDLPLGLNIWDVVARRETCDHRAGIAAYMFRYGLCFPFDREIEALANAALFSPGSYYAFGRFGMLLLIPSQNRVVYAYGG